MRYAAAVICACALLFAGLEPGGASSAGTNAKTPATDAPNAVVLHHVSGSVNYQSSATATAVAVTDAQTFGENGYAWTQANSVGKVVFPDASQLTLGGNSAVQVYDFLTIKKHVRWHHDVVEWNGSTIRLPSSSAALRLDIPQWHGGDTTYVVLTRWARITVRAQSTLVGDSLNGDTVTCINCGAGDVVANVGGQDYAVGYGETMVIDAAGRVSINNTAEPVMQSFSAGGLSTAPLPTPTPIKKGFHWTPPSLNQGSR